MYIYNLGALLHYMLLFMQHWQRTGREALQRPFWESSVAPRSGEKQRGVHLVNLKSSDRSLIGWPGKNAQITSYQEISTHLRSLHISEGEGLFYTLAFYSFFCTSQ